MNNKKNVVILGAGPGGLCAAWNLVQDGYHVIVLEKEPVCGGQSITFERNGYRYDLGPHNIHPHRLSVTRFLEKNLGNQIMSHRMKAEIYFRRHRVDYPLVGIQVLRSLSFWTMLICGFSFVWRRLGAFLSPYFRDDGTYETWVINRFGRQFYNIFFGPYTEKTWGIPPSNISDIVARKRIAIRSIAELLKSVIFKKESYHPENPRLIKNLYPRKGVGEISDFFVKGIYDKGGIIQPGCEVNKIIMDGNKVLNIYYTEHNQTKKLSFPSRKDNEGFLVLSTIPVNEMILMLDGNVPQEVKKAARELDFTSEIFLYLDLNKPSAFDVELLYFSESEFPFNRIYDIGLFSRDMVPEGKTAICLEITCTFGDDMWNCDPVTLFEKCIRPLEEHHLLSRNCVEGYHIRRLSHAYPRFRVGYKKNLRTIFDYIETIPNLITFGREGMFSYTNVDDVLWMAFEIAKEIPYRDRIGLTIDELLPEYIDF